MRPVKDAPLFNFGIGASFELDKAMVQPIVSSFTHAAVVMHPSTQFLCCTLAEVCVVAVCSQLFVLRSCGVEANICFVKQFVKLALDQLCCTDAVWIRSPACTRLHSACSALLHTA